MVAAALVLAAALPWFALSPDKPPEPPSTQPQAESTAPRSGPPAAVVPAAAPVIAATEPAPVTCPHQRLDLAWGTQKLVACASDTRARQTGSVRSLSVAAEGTSRWSLRVDTAGGLVVAARLSQRAVGREPVAEFGCAGDACRGFEIGAPDRHGMRLLQARDARLVTTRAAAAAGDAAVAEVVLRAALQIAPDRQNPALACAMPHVDVVRSDNGTAEFCPAGGAGFELAADGQTQFVFNDLEGRRLALTMGADGALLRVVYGALSCEASRCGGVSVQVQGDAGNPSSQRTFSFAGTTLAGPRAPGASAPLSAHITAHISAQISGQLTMPAQE